VSRGKNNTAGVWWESELKYPKKKNLEGKRKDTPGVVIRTKGSRRGPNGREIPPNRTGKGKEENF